ncbi:MAG: Type I Iterative PKS [Chrysothrix sp. TS-e1954]|nr:MAG: Type I Iterative PKS [Chrysothrix sp. TS-e1954]
MLQSNSSSAGTPGVKVLYFSGEIPQGDPEGDQRDVFRRIHLLSKQRDHVILASFLETVTTSLKEECSTLPRAERVAIPSFESVLDLTNHVVELRKSPLGGAIERVLVLVFQVGSFVAYHENRPLEYNFEASNTFCIGRGPGLLSAAVIGLSPSIAMIPSMSDQITKVAFRFGKIVDQVCRSVEISPDEINAEGAWIYCAHGANEREAIDAVAQFNIDKALSETSMASVFNVDGRSVSIGGPPSTLAALFSECEYFQHTKNVPMKKVQGFWHTARNYGKEHARQAVPDASEENLMHLDLLSPVTGEPFPHTNSITLLESVMEEVFTQNIRWDLTIASLTKRLKRLSPSSINLISIQPSHYMDSLLEHWRSEIPGAALSSKNVVPATMEMPLGLSKPRDAKSSKIAVIGMACRFPGGADNTERFWEILAQGKDTHTTIPADRFDAETHVDPSGKKPNTSRTPYGNFVESPGLFDAMFFEMSPREAEQTDPMQRLALVTAYEALEHAGFMQGRGIHSRRIGTFYGQASDDYREVNTGQDVGTYYIPGGCRAFGPGRINYFFKFWGPSFSVDTACSSSLAAIQAACTSLWSGDVDMAITGGMNILTNSDVYAGLSDGHFLSPTGNCKTWDEGADGYCRSDGVGSVVLKRLEDAEADNDNILGVVLSGATDHSAEAVSITHPHDVAQAHLYNQVSRRAGIDPLSVGYVEMHGTGTQAGDKMEMQSVTSVFAPENGRRAAGDIPLHVGTVKSNMGHGEAAAGIMAFIKTLLVFQKGKIPPHIGIKTRKNPILPDLTTRNVIIPDTMTTWRTGTKPRLAMVNNFGAAGGNTSLIVEEAKPRPRVGEDPRQAHVLTVSAKTAISFHKNLERLSAYLEAEDHVSLADLAYTLSARRSHYNYRLSILARSSPEAVRLLQPNIETALDQKPVSGKQAPVAFMFTGQGTFYVGIGKQLYQYSHVFRMHLDQLNSLAQRQNFSSFLPIIEGTCEVKDVSTESLHLAVVSVEIALARLWVSYGVKPSVVIGHSLGEYAALAIAGVLSDSVAIFLVGTRASLLDTKCTSNTHGMLSVRASVSHIEGTAKDIPFEVCCINSPNETVVGGTCADLDALTKVLTTAGHKTFKLPVAHAYHTRQMGTILEPFIDTTRSVVCKKPNLPIISPQYARVLTSEDKVDVSYLATATREKVDFAGALTKAWDTGVLSESTIWLEMGPHPTLCGFVNRTLPDTRLTCTSLHRDEDSWTTLAKGFCSLYNAGMRLDWNAYHGPFEQSLRLVDAPSYAWNNKNYWIQYRGDWNLTKGRAVLDAEPMAAARGFSTSSIHQIVSEKYDTSMALITAESSITDSSLQAVVDGHAMNGHGVASSFLHADMAFTLARRIRDQGLPESAPSGINVRDFEYHEPVVKQRNTDDPQPIRITAEAHLDDLEVHVKFYNPQKDLWYSHATVSFEDPSAWLADWALSTKLITSRIEALNAMARSGAASKLKKDLAYSLFGKLVGYSEMYQTMQSVILNEDEAVAEVVFPSDTAGDWTVPPHFIDGCVSLSGFILNGGTHFDNNKNFFVTPSWESMRFAKPLSPGGRYLAYVRMVSRDSNSYAGDVYILQDDAIVGFVKAIVFLQWPRVMLNRFFSPPDGTAKTAAPSAAHKNKQVSPPTPARPTRPAETPSSSATTTASSDSDRSAQDDTPPSPPSSNTSEDVLDGDPNDTIKRALVIVANELAVDIGQLTDEVELADLGLDSLMSLVLSQRLREEMGIEMRDAFFLEVDTIGALKKLFH